VAEAARAVARADAEFATTDGQQTEVRHARGALLALQEALVRHAVFFGEEGR
jgi:hypothetical protein